MDFILTKKYDIDFEVFQDLQIYMLTLMWEAGFVTAHVRSLVKNKFFVE